MALSFTASTDKVTVTAAAPINNRTTRTDCAWVYIPTVVTSGRIWQKGLAGGGIFTGFEFINTGSGDLSMSIQRATTTLVVDALLSNFSAWAVDKWVFVANVLDTGGAGSAQKLYLGDLTTLAVEPSAYINQSAGSGALPDESSADLVWGNKSNDGAPLTGRIECGWLFNTSLSQANVQLVQTMRPPGPIHGSACVGFWRFGMPSATATQVDGTGNGRNGTVTDCSIAAGAPLDLPSIPDFSAAMRAANW